MERGAERAHSTVLFRRDEFGRSLAAGFIASLLYCHRSFCRKRLCKCCCRPPFVSTALYVRNAALRDKRDGAPRLRQPPGSHAPTPDTSPPTASRSLDYPGRHFHAKSSSNFLYPSVPKPPPVPATDPACRPWNGRTRNPESPYRAACDDKGFHFQFTAAASCDPGLNFQPPFPRDREGRGGGLRGRKSRHAGGAVAATTGHAHRFRFEREIPRFHAAAK